MDKVNVRLDDREYVILPREEYDRLAGLAKAGELPPLPKPDRAGNVPAVEYARASLARKIIRGRAALGMTQRELAKRAGIAFEHLNRIEKGRVTATVATAEKIERALRQGATRKRA